MTDKLQQFIDENREAFDAQEPPPELWTTLQQKRNNKNKNRRMHIPRQLMWAASFAAVAFISITIYSVFQKNSPPAAPGSTAGEPAEFIDLLDPMQARQISQYKEVIELKENELKLLEKEQPELYQQFITDIQRLDSAYTALKSQLPDNPNRELLLEAMISNLQLQSELLSRHLKIIKEIKQQKYRS